MTIVNEIKNKVKAFKPTSHGVNIFDPNLNDKSSRFLKFKDDKGSKFKIWIYTDRIKIETSLATSLLFSLNVPDKVCLANEFLKELRGIGKIFTDKSKDDQILVCIELLKDDLIALNFSSNEGLTVYRNGLQLTLMQNREILPEIDTCNKIKTLIERCFPDKVSNNDYSDLPDDLRQLLKKLEAYAITDDLERDEKIKKLTAKQRSDLIKMIEPSLQEINFFLETFADKPLTEGAIGLQCLTELIIELTYEK